MLLKRKLVYKKKDGGKKGGKTRVGILHGILHVEIELEYDTVREEFGAEIAVFSMYVHLFFLLGQHPHRQF